jgi:hypothetical protein
MNVIIPSNDKDARHWIEEFSRGYPILFGSYAAYVKMKKEVYSKALNKYGNIVKLTAIKLATNQRFLDPKKPADLELLASFTEEKPITPHIEDVIRCANTYRQGLLENINNRMQGIIINIIAASIAGLTIDENNLPEKLDKPIIPLKYYTELDKELNKYINLKNEFRKPPELI